MLTVEQKAENDNTWNHINRVQHFINIFVKELIDRAERHDQSKLASPEVEKFAEFNHKLSALTYGTSEYDANKKLLGEALVHHYAKNTHHPEHFKNGIRDMSLVDIVEMFCDWRAATERHNDGNIRKSIEYNASPERFNFSQDLTRIFENTVELFE